MGKNTSKNLSSKCSQELFDHAEKSATDALKKLLQKEHFKKQQKQLVV